MITYHALCSLSLYTFLQAIEKELKEPHEIGAESQIMFEDEEICINITGPTRCNGWRLLPLNALVVITTHCLCVQTMTISPECTHCR